MLLKIAVAGALIATLGSGPPSAIQQQTQTEESTNVVTAIQSEESLAQQERYKKLRQKDHVSRSSHVRNPEAPSTTRVSLVTPSDGGFVRKTPEAAQGVKYNRRLGRHLAKNRGWTKANGQWGCLRRLWNHESGWSSRASNPYTSAHGIPQALPGSKMASAGPRWWKNPRTQIKWGLRYIKGRYSTPCGAWGHFLSSNWY